MRHVPLKRLLMVLVPCVLIIGIMLPLTAFAATAKHQAPAAVNTANTATTVGINHRCGPAGDPLEGPQTLATLSRGQEIDITATVTGDDANAEQEALSVYAEFQPFIRIVFANTGTHSFEYEATNIAAGTTVRVLACFVLVRFDDENDFDSSTFFAAHTATVTYEVEAASIKESEI